MCLHKEGGGVSREPSAPSLLSGTRGGQMTAVWQAGQQSHSGTLPPVPLSMCSAPYLSLLATWQAQAHGFPLCGLWWMGVRSPPCQWDNLCKAVRETAGKEIPSLSLATCIWASPSLPLTLPQWVFKVVFQLIVFSLFIFSVHLIS